MRQTILAAVEAHPGCMSPIMLDHFLRGQVFGRMADKGLLESPHFGALAGADSQQLTDAIFDLLREGAVSRADGFYPALSLATKGVSA
jgi:hypothetical protein